MAAAVILPDTSIWIAHLRVANPALGALAEAHELALHPFVLGEIALGTLARRRAMLEFLSLLPAAPCASEAEVLHLIEAQLLYGCGIGYVDAHLLASVRMGSGARLWTLDRSLAAAAERLGVGFSLQP